MNQQPILTPRQAVTYFMILVGFILFAIGLWFLFTHGGLRVKTTTDTAEILVVPENAQNNTAAEKTGNGLDAFLKNGNYIVTVKDGDKQIRTVVTVSSFAIKEINLTPPEIAFSEAVTNLSASSYAVSSTALSLLDSKQEELVMINSENSYQHTDDLTLFDSAVWQRAGEGFAVARDFITNDRLFMQIKNGEPTAIATPKAIDRSTYLAFGIGTNGNLYIIQNGDFYERMADGSYVKIGNTNKEALVLSVNQNYATFLYRNTEEVCEIQFMNLASKAITKRTVDCVQSPTYVYAAAWSQDGKELALTTGSALEILNDKLETTLTIPDYKAVNPLWLKNGQLLYTSENNIWSYETPTNTASVIASTPIYVSVTSLQKSDDTDTLYFSGSADDTPTIYRVKPTGDIFDSAQLLAESNMQILSNICYTRYINFTKLQFILMTADSVKEECTQQANDYLQSINASVDSLQFDIREEFGYTDYLLQPDEL